MEKKLLQAMVAEIGDSILDIEGFHKFIFKQAKEITKEMEHRPMFFFLIGTKIYIFDLVPFFQMGDEGKNLAESFALKFIKDLKPRMMAFVSESWIRSFDKKEDVKKPVREYEDKIEALLIQVEDMALGQRLWIYEIEPGRKNLTLMKNKMQGAEGRFSGLLKRGLK